MGWVCHFFQCIDGVPDFKAASSGACCPTQPMRKATRLTVNVFKIPRTVIKPKITLEIWNATSLLWKFKYSMEHLNTLYCTSIVIDSSKKKRKQSVWNYEKSKQKKPELPSHSTLRHSLRLHGSPQYPVEMTHDVFLCYRNACSQFRRLSAAAFFSSCWTFPGIENWLMPHRSTCPTCTAATLPMRVYVCNMLLWVHCSLNLCLALPKRTDGFRS